MSLDSWSGMEEFLKGEESDEQWLHFVSNTTPDYMWEHRQNMYETELQEEYTVDYR